MKLESFALTISGLLLAAAPLAAQLGASDVEDKRGPKIDLRLPNEDVDRGTVAGVVRASKHDAAQLVKAWADHAGIDEAAYSAAETTHFALMARADAASIEQLCQVAEYVYRRLNWITHGKTDVNPFKTSAKGKPRYFYVEKQAYDDLLVFMGARYPSVFNKKTVAEIKKLMADGTGGFNDHDPMPVVLNRSHHNISSSVANTFGSNWTYWNTRQARAELNIKTKKPEGVARGRGHLMTWLTEGVGIWAAIDAIGRNKTYRFTQQVYKNVGRAKKGADNDYVAMCYELATGQFGKKTAIKSFYQVSRSGLNKLTDLDLAMSWSIIDWLITERTSEWRDFIKRLSRTPSMRISFIGAFGTPDEKKEVDKLIKTKNDRGLWKLYQVACGRFEQQWKAWASKRYQAEYEDPSKKKSIDSPFKPLNLGAAEEGDDKDKDSSKKKKKKKKKKRRRR